jgi:hypothetical protein
LNGPVQIFTAITLIALPTVMFGGFSLLRLLIGGRLNEFQLTYFRGGFGAIRRNVPPYGYRQAGTMVCRKQPDHLRRGAASRRDADDRGRRDRQLTRESRPAALLARGYLTMTDSAAKAAW